MLPEHWKLNEINDYVMHSFRHSVHESRQVAIKTNLRRRLFLNTYAEWAKERSKSVVVSKDKVCSVCHRRLDSSVKGFPSDADSDQPIVVHLACAQQFPPFEPPPSVWAWQYNEMLKREGQEDAKTISPNM